MSTWQEAEIRKELSEINGFNIANLKNIDKFDTDTVVNVILILLKWACYPQNDTTILLGRRLIGEIPSECLSKYIISAVKDGFEYEDYWNFQRLLEISVEYVPSVKADILELNRKSDDPDIIEILTDYS